MTISTFLRLSRVGCQLLPLLLKIFCLRRGWGGCVGGSLSVRCRPTCPRKLLQVNIYVKLLVKLIKFFGETFKEVWLE